jgi:hypothetical protein
LEVILAYESRFMNEPARTFSTLKTKEHVSKYLLEAAILYVLCVLRYIPEASTLMRMNIYSQDTTQLGGVWQQRVFKVFLK